MYKHDFRKIASHLSINAFRKEKFKAWYAMVAVSIHEIRDEFLAFIDQTRDRLRFDFRRQYLERYLNEKFDPQSKRIRIANSRFLPKIWHFQEEENQEVWHFNDWDATYSYDQDDYCVHMEYDDQLQQLFFDIYKSKVKNNLAFNPRLNSSKWSNETQAGNLPRPWVFNKEDYAQEARYWVILPGAMALTPLLEIQMREAISELAYDGYKYKIGYTPEYLLHNQNL